MPEFELVTRAEQPTAVVHEKVPMKELPQFFARAYGQVFGAMQAEGLTPAGPPFALYFGMPTDTVEVEAGFPVSEKLEAQRGAVLPGTLPGGRCVHGLHLGPYETMKKTYDELWKWAGEKQLRPHAEMWESYLSDPKAEPDPTRWRTEIFWPVD